MDASCAVFWSGVLEFRRSDSELLCMYLAGLLPCCSLSHTINLLTHVVIPIEVHTPGALLETRC